MTGGEDVVVAASFFSDSDVHAAATGASNVQLVGGEEEDRPGADGGVEGEDEAVVVVGEGAVADAGAEVVEPAEAAALAAAAEAIQLPPVPCCWMYDRSRSSSSAVHAPRFGFTAALSQHADDLPIARSLDRKGDARVASYRCDKIFFQ
ncbi:hypothetical protein OsJ_20481 [Oryza sativa Japonica Group]|uniref:Uncharacterized protein n=1 Tax=Oryza sativa subsp. japonica TaxID=39947 RepID=B9FS10_ORYSJ|nr:hypothetical protein OsJ_20481 [Oryza sativa Japonica Group]